MSRKIGQGQKPKGHTNKKSQNKDREIHIDKHKGREDKYKKTAPSKLATGMSRKIGQGQKQRQRETQREMSCDKKDKKTKTDTKKWQRGKNAASGVMVVQKMQGLTQNKDKIDMTLW